MLPASQVEPGEVIGDRWRVVKLLAHGGFSSVYEAVDVESAGEKACALKIERTVDRVDHVTKMEVAIWLKLRGVSPHVCGLIGCGRVRDRLNYVIMTMAGPDLTELRRKRPSRQLQTVTILRLAIQCVQSIQDLHDAGFLHRDIKPANFATGRTNFDCRTVYILDFGSARRYVTNGRSGTDEVRPPRESAGFRGTLRYSSPMAHYSADLGCNDDLWSLFYVLIELRAGSLPWKETIDHYELGRIKRHTSVDELLSDEEDLQIFIPMETQLKKLRYEQKPDYDWFIGNFCCVQQKYGYATDGPFEWEQERDW